MFSSMDWYEKTFGYLNAQDETRIGYLGLRSSPPWQYSDKWSPNAKHKLWTLNNTVQLHALQNQVDAIVAQEIVPAPQWEIWELEKSLPRQSIDWHPSWSPPSHQINGLWTMSVASVHSTFNMFLFLCPSLKLPPPPLHLEDPRKWYRTGGGRFFCPECRGNFSSSWESSSATWKLNLPNRSNIFPFLD